MLVTNIFNKIYEVVIKLKSINIIGMDKLSKFNFAITVYTKLIISIKSLTRSTGRKFMKISVTKYS